MSRFAACLIAATAAVAFLFAWSAEANLRNEEGLHQSQHVDEGLSRSPMP